MFQTQTFKYQATTIIPKEILCFWAVPRKCSVDIQFCNFLRGLSLCSVCYVLMKSLSNSLQPLLFGAPIFTNKKNFLLQETESYKSSDSWTHFAGTCSSYVSSLTLLLAPIKQCSSVNTSVSFRFLVWLWHCLSLSLCLLCCFWIWGLCKLGICLLSWLLVCRGF